MVDDLLGVCFEWVSIVSGLVHFHIIYDFGTAEEIDLLLNALLNIFGFTAGFL